MIGEQQSNDNLQELLSEPLYMLPPSATLQRASMLMREQKVSSLLVHSKDEPTGIITEHDILIASAQQVNPSTPVSEFMSSPVISVTESTAVRQGHNLLSKYNIRHLLITDEAQSPLGILSTSDFRSRLSSSFLTRLRSIKRLMSHWFIALPAETPAQQVMEVMAKREASCIVITRDRKPCGLVTEADTVALFSEGSPQLAAQDIMSTQVQTVKLDTSVPEVLALFQHQASRYLVVVDQDNFPVGLISEHDIIRQIELHFAATRESQTVALVNREHHYEHKYQAIFDTTNAFLILLNPEGQVVEINGAAQEMFGCSYESIIGKPLYKTPRLATEKKAQKQLRRAVEGAKLGNFRQLVAEHLDESGNAYWVEYRFQPMLNEDKALELILIEGFDISELKRTQMQLQSQAFYDPLTNLPNRSLLSERMKLALGQRKHSLRMLAIAYLDLDHFKPVNDKLGHDVGDLLLKEVADRLSSSTRNNDTVSRLGGDEFVILMPELSDSDHAEEMVRNILRKVAEPYTIRDHSIEVSASIGYTICQGDDADADILMRQADQAMYRAKQLGRNRSFVFDKDENDSAINHLKLVSQLRSGMAAAQLELFYQPKVNMRTSEVIGVEALVRWLHPTRGLLSPNDFLPKLTDHPVMSELDHWVLLQSIRQVSAWRQMGVNLTLNVNISGHSLKNQAFVDTLERLLENHPELPRSFLELEILENTALEQISNIGDVVSQCRAMGVGFALDDFGTGYSSLAHLKQLPADTIKIDCAFVQNIMHDPGNLAICEGILGLAKAFRLKTVAEGVEHLEQGEMLMHLGCEIAQGYAISPPIPPSQLPTWVSNFKSSNKWEKLNNNPVEVRNFPLLAATVDHRSWVNDVIAAISSNDKLTFDNQDKCKFGHWLNNEGAKMFGHRQDWHDVNAMHSDIHSFALALLEEKSSVEVKSQIPKLLQKRDALLDIIHEWFAQSTTAV